VLRLEAVLVGGCGYWDYGCEATVPVVVSPPVPMGAGSVELDASGRFVQATLSLEAHSRDGTSVPAWARELRAADLGGADPSPAPGELWGYVQLTVERFVSPAVFAGTFAHHHTIYGESGAGEIFSETYTFSTTPAPEGWTPLACAGARLHVDADADGEEDARDRAPLGFSDGSFGTSVDAAGRTIADFCALAAASKKACARLDFGNDEPLRRRPRDCRFESFVCVPAELTPPANPPPFSGATCQDLPVFSDADRDAESDSSDRCPATPAGSPIDEAGCALAEFCALTPLAACARADFANDEPSAKRPGDCAHVRQQCVPAR
jgi:hypothetical protein